MNKRIILTAAFFGALAVALGAFGAHRIKSLIDTAGLNIWQKGVEYQFYHVFALLYLSTFARYKNKLINVSFIFFTLGIILFSGSLYALTIAKITDYQNLNSIVGPITPIGGVCLLLGWVFLFLATLRDK